MVPFVASYGHGVTGEVRPPVQAVFAGFKLAAPVLVVCKLDTSNAELEIFASLEPCQ